MRIPEVGASEIPAALRRTCARERPRGYAAATDGRGGLQVR